MRPQEIDNLISLFDRAQGLYLESFTRWLADVPENARVILEGELRDSDGNIAVEGKMSLPLRLDAVVLRPEQKPDSITIASARTLSFAPFEIRWRGLPVEVHPFAWDYLLTRAYGAPAEFDWTPLRSWFAVWFAERPSSKSPFLNCVHFLSDAEHDAQGCARFEIDLGSSPPEALIELFDGFADCGLSRLIIGNCADT